MTVYKIGGSLFDWPALFARLAAFLASEATRPLIVSGGGGAADVVRNWDRVHALGERRSHQLAIASLSLGSEFLADGLRAPLVTTRDEAEGAWREERIAVLDAASFLAHETATGAEALPASWNVTSDSIAAWVAERWPAALVLLKSASPDDAPAPYVDPYFQTASSGLASVAWVNLRRGERGRFPRCTPVTSKANPSLVNAKAEHVV